ncbi:MAG: hypothetical protein ACTTI7_00630 [Gemella haemolysans]|uniref:hypothetical protein n=1 Tax=Gemella haemolysans TaxID=1379 RepID=UPI003FA0EE6E
MSKNNNNSPTNNNNQNGNYENYNQNSEQNYNKYYQNNNQYYNQNSNQYFEKDPNLGNYNQQYNNYNQDYSQYNSQGNFEQEQYSNDYNYNTQNTNQYYNNYQQDNYQNFGYSEQSNTQNNYNQNYQQDNFNYTQQNASVQTNYEQDYQVNNNQNLKYFDQANYNSQSYQQSNTTGSYVSYNQASTPNEQKNVENYNVNQTSSNNNQQSNTQNYNSTQGNSANYQQSSYQNQNNQNRDNIPPIPPVMNPKNFNNSPKQPKKKSKGRLVATVSSLLALLLVAGGGYYYYTKHSKPKVVNENEIYGTIIQKYKDAINNPDNTDSSINVAALKAALKEKKNDDYIKYVFYDIDGNGRKELIISRNDKPNNPFDIYTFDKKHKVIRLFNPETIDSAILNKLGVDGSNNNSGSAVFKDKTIRIRKFDKDTGEYNFLKFSNDGDKLEKTNVITFTGLDADDSKYKDITNNKEYNSKKEFNDTFPIAEVMKFDNENWQSVKKFGGSSSNENNEKKEEKKDNNQRKKPDNYETAYVSVLKNYKDAISSGKNDAKDVNTVAITNYKVFGEKQVGNNFLNYGFFDINGDGIDELLLFTEASKDKPNEYSPMDVYTLDKDNKVVRITPERVNGERITLSITKDKIFQVYGSGGAKVHGYTFYKLNSDGLALEKTDAFDFDAETNSKVYKRSYPSGKNEEIPVNNFRDKMVNSNNHMKFDFGKRKSIFDFKG